MGSKPANWCWTAVGPYHQDGPLPGGSGPGPARRARRRRRAQRHLRAGHERRRGRARDGDGEAHGLEGPREPHGAHPGAGEEQTAHEAALDPRAARGRRAERDVGRRGGAARRVRRAARGAGGGAAAVSELCGHARTAPGAEGEAGGRKQLIVVPGRQRGAFGATAATALVGEVVVLLQMAIEESAA